MEREMFDLILCLELRIVWLSSALSLLIDSPLKAYNDHTLLFRHDDIRWDHVYGRSFHFGSTNIYPLPTRPPCPNPLRG